MGAALLLCVMFSAPGWAQPSAFVPEKPAPSPGVPAAPGTPPAPEAAAAPEQPADPVEAALAGMGLTQRVAQLMMITLDGVKGPSASDRALMAAAMPGAVLLNKANKPSTVTAYTTQLKRMGAVSGVPLWIGADLHELTAGAVGSRSVFFPMPSLLTLAAADDGETARQTGDLLALHLQALGFNLCFGPPLGLAPAPGAGSGSVNCLGSDPEKVARLGRILMECHLARGVLPMPTGFPGGGFNRSGRDAAVLTTAPSLMEGQDLRPFREAVAAGAGVIHVGNTLVPLLDTAGLPASLSPAVLGELLREKLGFTGVVVAGPMDAGDVSGMMDPAEAGLEALRAGADMLLWRGATGQAKRTIERITVAVGRGELAESVVNGAARRVLQAKLNPRAATTEAVDADKLSSQKDLLERVQSAERRAITLVHHRAGTLPLRRETSTPAGITGTAGVSELRAALEKPLKQVMEQPIGTARHIGEIQRFEIERLTGRMRAVRTVVCVLSDRERVETQIELLRELRKKCDRLVVVHLGWPAQAHRLSDADAILLAYSPGDTPEQTMAAVAEVLLGTGPVGFAELPDEIRLKAGEARTFSVADVARTPAGRLPITLSDRIPAGTAARFDATAAVKKAQWDFAGKRVNKPEAVFQFDAPGTYPVTVTLTDTRGEARSRTFKAVVE
ncbi:MAG: hypothetical protein H3C30_14440 [Candidatus Hydrogenedentes bacterium]|nr:hypothetical protein [Candidatus Hydrogenedentota bacterium]